MYAYELRSINLRNLPDREAAGVVESFGRFLNSLSSPITFYVISDTREVQTLGPAESEGASRRTRLLLYQTPYKRFFVESPAPIDDLVGRMVPKFVRVPYVPLLKLKSVFPEYALDEESNFVKAYAMTRLGGSMYPGFLNELYPITHTVKVMIEPVDQYKARDLARGYARSVGVRIGIRQVEGRSADPEENILYERALAASNAIAAGTEKLFIASGLVVLRAKTHQDLMEARRKVRQVVGSAIGGLDSPKWLQFPLLTGAGPGWATGKKFYLTTPTATTFIPFAGLDIVDPEGVLMGQNLQTGNAVVYDIFEKENYNLSILGSTGFGKSTLVKSLFGRMANANPEMMLFVFDSIVKPEYGVGPDGTYENSFAGLTGCMVKRFTEQAETGAGLDPFRVLPTKRMAADFLMSISGLEPHEKRLIARFYKAADLSSSVADLFARIDEMTKDEISLLQRDREDALELKARLEVNLDPYLFLFRGEFEFFSRTVFVLYDIPVRQIRDAATFLALSAVYNEIQRQPTATRKAVVIDEGWALVEKDPATGTSYFPLAVTYVPQIARAGRHSNICFCVATQMASDLLGRGGEYGPGRDLVESCATKIVLRQDQAAAGTIREAFNLSQDEESFILDAEVGRGLLLTGDGHVPFFNFLSPNELQAFTTRPKEVRG